MSDTALAIGVAGLMFLIVDYAVNGGRKPELERSRIILVLSRQRDECIFIGDNIKITVVDIRGDKVRLGIDAPTNILVHRQEIWERIHRNDHRDVTPNELGGEG